MLSLCLVAAIHHSTLMRAMPAQPATAALAALAHRVLGKQADAIEFRLKPSAGADKYTVSAKNGHVVISANSASAASRGLYDYMKAGGSLVTWDGSRIAPNLPNCALGATAQAKYRHYYNVCTFGYSTAFWAWPDWEREIDWMALHGLNFPLAMVGQEAVWEKVWRRHGLTDREIRGFFSGPAFLPWHRMGNINTHGGPLPQSWIDNQITLQKRILGRMRELGITPVLPAFSGFLPPVFAQKHPELRTRKSSAWAGFDPTVLLDPRDPMFIRIGKEFIDTYRQMYGTDGYYLADVFNEMTPQVAPETKLDDLRNTGRSVYEAIRAGDPNGIWVTQGWLFINDAGFWGEPEIDAYLSQVPKDKIILLDLYAENTEIWRKSAAFRQRPYIWNMLHNFGGKTPLMGDLDSLSRKVSALESDPNRGRWSGMGLTMEGINQNAPMYELMTDLMWSNPGSADAWFEHYLSNRYGSREVANRIAGPLKKTFYSGSRAFVTLTYQSRPTLDGVDPTDTEPAVANLANLMLAQKDAWANPLYRKDTLDVAKQAIADAIGLAFAITFDDLSEAKPAPDENSAFALMFGLDSVLDTVPQYRLSDWVKRAEACVAPPDQALLAKNARLQLTQWGGPDLSEYAAKEWAGLLRNYYAPRWEMLFAAMRHGQTDETAFRRDLIAWENRWIAGGPDGSVQPRNLRGALLSLLRVSASIKPRAEGPIGLAVGKPASDSGHTEPGGLPSYAVDGKVSGGWWSASPYPQWWQVDLTSPTVVNRVQVFTYYGDGRYYQYTVQVSLDGHSWTTVADFSKNTTPARRQGFEHTFAVVTARYVRVNMLFNSANVGVHLREVRVFGP